MLFQTVIGFRLFLQTINDQNMKWRDTSRVKYMHIHLIDKSTHGGEIKWNHTYRAMCFKNLPKKKFHSWYCFYHLYNYSPDILEQLLCLTRIKGGGRRERSTISNLLLSWKFFIRNGINKDKQNINIILLIKFSIISNK